MTLIDDNDKNIPGWKKAIRIFNKNPNIKLEYGVDFRKYNESRKFNVLLQ